MSEEDESNVAQVEESESPMPTDDEAKEEIPEAMEMDFSNPPEEDLEDSPDDDLGNFSCGNDGKEMNNTVSMTKYGKKIKGSPIKNKKRDTNQNHNGAQTKGKSIGPENSDPNTMARQVELEKQLQEGSLFTSYSEFQAVFDEYKRKSPKL